MGAVHEFLVENELTPLLARPLCAKEKVVRFQESIACRRLMWVCLLVLSSFYASTARGQDPAGRDPAPETAPTLFPGGGLVSFNSGFTTRGLTSNPSGVIPLTARPTFSHAGVFIFRWGFHRDFDLTVLVPVITNHYEMASPNGNLVSGGTGIGDAMLLVKYRFYRQDSERGTTQASVTFGPKLPTGRTDLNDVNGNRLPASLQPGSGSTDFFLAANWTYTGLFNVKRLVADGDFNSLVRSTGTQDTRLGIELESRFWLSYTPYQSKDVKREWLIGPSFVWMHRQDDMIAGVTQYGSGGGDLLAGITTFLGVRPGMHIWLRMDWDVAHSSNPGLVPGGHDHVLSGLHSNQSSTTAPVVEHVPLRRCFTFGITQQFRFHH
jgi:hypothetical protein